MVLRRGVPVPAANGPNYTIGMFENGLFEVQRSDVLEAPVPTRTGYGTVVCAGSCCSAIDLDPAAKQKCDACNSKRQRKSFSLE